MTAHVLNVPVTLAEEACMLCSRGCGVFMIVASGDIRHRNGGAADLTCGAVVAPAQESAVTGLSQALLVQLAASVRMPSRHVLAQERSSPSVRFGDPLLPDNLTGKESDSVGALVAEMEALYAVRLMALCSGVMTAVQALPAAAKAALPNVNLRESMGPDGTAPDATPLPVALAEIMVAASTMVGLTTLRGYAALDGKRWKDATTPCLRFDANGNSSPVSFYWHMLREVAAADRATVIPEAVYKVSRNVDEALGPLKVPPKVVLRGSGASLLKLAPAVGLLRSSSASPAAHAPLASFWGVWRGAVSSAAEATRKEYKAFSVGSPRTPSTSAAAPSPIALTPFSPTPATPFSTVSTPDSGGGGDGRHKSKCVTCGRWHAGACWHVARAPAGGGGGGGGRGRGGGGRFQQQHHGGGKKGK